MRHASGVSRTMRSVFPPRLTSFSLMALLALGAIAVMTTHTPKAGAASAVLGTNQAPVPTNAGTDPSVDLAQSACTDVTACVAVGSYEDASGDRQMLIETYSAGTWTPSEGQLPSNAGADPDASLNAISCPISAACAAVGSYIDSDGNQQALIDTLVNGTWVPTEAALPGDADGTPDVLLNAIDCTTPTACVAVGSYDAKQVTVDELPLIETLAAGTWAPAAGALPADAGSGNLNGVSCPSVGACVAVGVYNVMTQSGGLENVHTLPLVSTLAAGAWTPSEGAIPGNADASTTDSEAVELLSDSCNPTGLCQAVGTFADGTGNSLPLVETLSGGTWTVADPLLPSDADDQGTFAMLVSVSCPELEPCVAVGNYAQNGGNQHALIERGSVNSWTPSDAPLPSGANANPSDALTGISCRTAAPAPPTTSTTSVPSTSTTSTSTTPVTTSETASTSTTSTTTTPTPPTSPPTTTTTTAPAPVTTASSCSAVGSYQDQGGLMQGLIDQPVTPDPASD